RAEIEAKGASCRAPNGRNSGQRSAAYRRPPHAGRCARNSISVIFAIKRGFPWLGERMKRLALATVIAVALTSPALAQSSIAILTGSTSGVYYPLGSTISAIFLKTIPGARSNVQVTQGSVENLKLLEDGDGE